MRSSLPIVVGVVVVMSIATVQAQSLYVPAAAHAPGVGDTQWRTDLEVKAATGAQVTVRIDLLASEEDNSSPASITRDVAAGTCVRFDDLLGDEFSHTGTGALRVTPTAGSILVTSRTYNDDPEGTYGQFIPAYAVDQAFTAGQTAAIIQLTQGSGYRTNVGFLNTTAASIAIEVELYDASGSMLGTLGYTLAPYEHLQVGQIFTLVTSAAVADGFVMVRTTTTGGAFLTYASVVDNDSGDAIFIPGQPSPAQGGPPQGTVLADHWAAMAFEDIPLSAIQQARAAFGEIFYGHTSHGSQVVTGLGMVENEYATHVMPNFIEVSEDLGGEGDLGWVQTTRDALADYPDYPMVVWSWCGGVSDNTVAGINVYLNAMSQLEADYPDVVFVYMTGHLDGSGPDGNLRQRNDQIRDYCAANDKVLFDFADIERHDPAGFEHEWGSDWCDWCEDWCADHSCPGCDDCAHSQCMNCFQKGKAFWWMLARLAGWEG